MACLGGLDSYGDQVENALTLSAILDHGEDWGTMDWEVTDR